MMLKISKILRYCSEEPFKLRLSEILLQDIHQIYVHIYIYMMYLMEVDIHLIGPNK